MLRNSLALFVILLLSSCGGNDLPDLVKFKSGLYGSRAGEFIAKFPDKPSVSSRHYQLGAANEFNEFVFQYRVGMEHRYVVSYIDFPNDLIKGWDTEQLFDQTIQNISAQLDDYRISDRQVNQVKGYDKSITYALFSSTPGAMMKARLLKRGERIYYIYFACAKRQPNTEDIDAFLDSFQLYQPKDS